MEAQMVQAVGTIVSPVAMVAVIIYMMREFGGRLDRIGNRIDKLDARLSDRMDKLDARLSQRMDRIDSRIDKIDSRIEGLQGDHKNLASQLSELRGILAT